MAGLIDGIWPTSESQWDAMVANVRDDTDDETWLFSLTSGLPEKGRQAVTDAHENLMERFGAAGGDVVEMAKAEADFYRAAMKAWKGRDVPKALAIESRSALCIELEVLKLHRIADFRPAGLQDYITDPLRNLHQGIPTLSRVLAANSEATPWSAATMLSAGLIRGGVEVKTVQPYLATGFPSEKLPEPYEYEVFEVRSREELPDDIYVRNAFCSFVGKHDARLPLEYELAIREAIVLRHGEGNRPQSRQSAAAEMSIKMGHQSAEIHGIIREAKSVRRMVAEEHRALPEFLRNHPAFDRSLLLDQAFGQPKVDRRFAVLNAIADQIIRLERQIIEDGAGYDPSDPKWSEKFKVRVENQQAALEATASALPEIHRKLGRISLVSSVQVSARRAVDSWLDAKAGNPNIKSITAENGKVVAVIAPAGEPPVKVVDDGRRISCPTDCHEAIAASVAAFAKRGTTTLTIKAADVERAKIGYFECMRQGIKPVVELPVSTIQFLKDVRQAEIEGLREGLEGGNLAASVETYLTEAGYEGIDIEHAVGLVFRGQPPVEIGLFDTIDHDISDHEIGTFDTIDHDEPQSISRHRL